MQLKLDHIQEELNKLQAVREYIESVLTNLEAINWENLKATCSPEELKDHHISAKARQRAMKDIARIIS